MKASFNSTTTDIMFLFVEKKKKQKCPQSHKAFPRESRTNQEYLCFPFLLNIVLEALTRAVRKELGDKVDTHRKIRGKKCPCLQMV